MDVRTITRLSEEYPRMLAEIPTPPKLMYAVGKPLEQSPYISVVGSRMPTRYGLEVATWIAKELASSGVTVVSGMARGIDAAAHRGALAADGGTVAVLGCGIDVCYPPTNRDLYVSIAERGTLLSEYELGTRALRQNFPTRNRIIAGMSLGVVIVEGRIGGGAMITAKLATEFGREVFAIAGPVHAHQSQGPHSLVRDGARLVTSAADILEDLGLDAVASGEQWSSGYGAGLGGLTPDERAVLGVLEATPALLDVVAKQARMPPSGAAATLARLELKGLVARHPGARFALCASGSHPPHH